RAFVGRDPRAWTEQITIVATPPSHRQLASLATAVLNATEPAPLFTHGQAHSLVGRVLLGPDATAEDAAAARASAS
ncbi:MAG TPA: hypothetical protein VHV30_12620, partial [Polyangiaceae bacterium]|nr:hypothetical protein [Polyangiaceae bacterium]